MRKSALMKKRAMHRLKYILKKSEIISLTVIVLIFILFRGIDPVFSAENTPLNKESTDIIVEGIAYLPLAVFGIYVPVQLFEESLEKSQEKLQSVESSEKEAPKQIAASTDSKPSKVAYLTFDDGLDKKVTPKILDTLKQYEVKATFFILGNSVSKNKDVLKRMIDEGHNVGNHTYTHKKEIIYTDVKKFSDELARTSKAIYDAVGITPELFRPPYGAPYIRGKEYKDALSEYKIVLWNVDSMDSRIKGITGSEIVAAVKNQLKNKNKAIILFHSTSAREETAKALPEIIEYLIDNGYSILRLE